MSQKQKLVDMHNKHNSEYKFCFLKMLRRLNRLNLKMEHHITFFEVEDIEKKLS